MNCPIGKKDCPCPEYSKEGLCDYPFSLGMVEAKRLGQRSGTLSPGEEE